MNVDFLISYEHKAREIESVALIRAELERRGYSVALSCSYDRERAAFIADYRAKVVLTSALYNDACLYGFVYSLAGYCGKVVNLQWEQALTNRDESDPLFYQNPKGRAVSAVHACWGEEPRNRLLKAGVEADRAVVVGPIQMDFTRAMFSEFFLDKGDLATRFDLDASKEWVLFISSFTFVNMSEEEYATEVQHMGPELHDFQALSVRSRDAILEWLQRAATEFPDKVFIYRPHPSENQDQELLSLETRYRNFRVIGELPIRQWMRTSSTVLSWYSTSAAEAFFLRKHCTVLRPVDIPYDWDVSVYRGARVVRDLAAFLQSLVASDGTFPLDEQLVRSYYDVKAETPTYTRLCNLLERVMWSNDYDMPAPSVWFRMQIPLLRLRHRVFFVLKDLIGRTHYRALLAYHPHLRSRIEHHHAVMERLERDRPKNQATPDELAELMTKLRKALHAS